MVKVHSGQPTYQIRFVRHDDYRAPVLIHYVRSIKDVAPTCRRLLERLGSRGMTIFLTRTRGLVKGLTFRWRVELPDLRIEPVEEWKG